MAEPVLRVEHLRKSFGGLRVIDDLSLEVAPGELHAIIGPNGAGKTTLINQISGLIAPDAGRIVFAGRDVTALPAHARAADGLARSFQVTSILPGFTALENVALAVQARAGSSVRMCPPVNSRTARNARSSSPLRSRCSPRSCCSTNPWPAPGARRPRA